MSDDELSAWAERQLNDPVDVALDRVDAAHKAYDAAKREAAPYVARREAALREWQDAWADYEKVRGGQP